MSRFQSIPQPTNTRWQEDGFQFQRTKRRTQPQFQQIYQAPKVEDKSFKMKEELFPTLSTKTIQPIQNNYLERVLIPKKEEEKKLQIIISEKKLDFDPKEAIQVFMKDVYRWKEWEDEYIEYYGEEEYLKRYGNYICSALHEETETESEPEEEEYYSDYSY
jgi:hypothetical protein